MCKVMIFSDLSKVKSLKKLVNVVAPLITAHDDDGFGWCALSSRGVFGERMTDVTHGYRRDLEGLAVKTIEVKKTYEFFGRHGALTGPALFHGRTSTNNVSLINTHPIERNAWHLIHNGVVTNHGPEYDARTTNDTEHLVHYLSTVGRKGIEEHLTGYFAVGAIDPTGALHIMRDNIAPLHVAWIESIESYIFATTRDLIEQVCKAMRYKAGPIDAVADNTHLIMRGNDVLSQDSLSPRGYGQREQGLMHKSLHYLDATPDVASTQDYALAQYGVTEQVIEEFLTCVECLTGNFRLYDVSGKEVTLHQFDRMSLDDQLQCTAYTSEGTFVSLESVARNERAS